MHDASMGGSTFGQYVHHIPIRIPGMDDHRQSHPLGELHLGDTQIPLPLAGSLVPVVIETELSNGINPVAGGVRYEP